MKTLNILQHNVHTWSTRKFELQKIYTKLDPHIILINSHGCKKEEELKIFNYKIQQNNITNSWQDGAALAVRRDVSFKRIDNLQEMLAVQVELEHEEVVVATGYCPFRRAAIPILDILKILNMDCPSYIIGDLNISSCRLGDTHTNMFGKQFEIIYTNHSYGAIFSDK